MASSGNFCTMNQIDTGAYATVTGGNLIVGGTGSSTADQAKRGATFYIQSGKWYWEVRQTVGGSSYGEVGISVGTAGTATPSANSGFSEGLMYQSIAGTLSAVAAGYVGLGTVTTTSTGVSAVSNNQVINIALDMDNRKLWFGKDGTYFNSGDPANGTNPQFSWTTDTFVTPTSRNYATNRPSHYNFGQDSTFGGNETAGGNEDGNSHGDFHSSVPTGFLALCSANLPISDDIDPAQTDDDYPSKQCAAVTFTGNGGTNNITGVGFQADLAFFKNRGTANSWIVVDSSRGGTGSGTKSLNLNGTGAESTGAYTTWNGFASDGFNLSGGGTGTINQSSASMYGMLWRANGGTTASNSNGQTTSTVQANQAAGFSIVEYAGSLTSSGTKTIGHGLSKAPEFYMIKNPNKAGRWFVWHTGMSGASYMLELNTTAAESDKSGNGSMSLPTSTVFSTNWTEGSNEYPYNHIAYVWHSVDGYSKFSSYKGNGNADGPFVYTGFRPRMLFLKRTDSTGAWHVFDTARNTFNPVNTYQLWNVGQADDGPYASNSIDFLSNGFKIRNSAAQLNTSGGDYIYGAWGDTPFKYNNTF
jgi:hypothetical protein